jgi:glutamyl-tRNA synthetase
MIAYHRARQCGGKVILRIEDLDHPRDKKGAASQILEDLRWLGFDWDEEYIQSERKSYYKIATEKLVSSGLIYPCTCSRKDVESAQSAPHAGEQLHYPGFCRGKYSSWDEAALQRPPCWRFKVNENTQVSFKDNFHGEYSQDVFSALGDFPIARDRFGAGYTLAVTVDDALLGVTEVVRGDDLLPATPAQILLFNALGLQCPQYCHVPLVVGPDGLRLAKRHGDSKISTYRASGIEPWRILKLLAHSCGWDVGSERKTLAQFVSLFSLETIPHSPFVFDGLIP